MKRLITVLLTVVVAVGLSYGIGLSRTLRLGVSPGGGVGGSPGDGGGVPLPSEGSVIIYNRNGVLTFPHHMLTRFDVGGNRQDVNITQIFQVGNVYYVLGDGYDCPFQYTINSPWCGTKMSKSLDFVNWTVAHKIVKTEGYEAVCGGLSDIGGCFVPRTVFNPLDNRWILWLNAPRGQGIMLQATEPGAPVDSMYTEITPPSGFPNFPSLVGDGAPFVDPVDGTGYYIYEVRGAGAMWISKLNASFTDSVSNWQLDPTCPPSCTAYSCESSGCWGFGDTPWIVGPLAGKYHFIWSAICNACYGARAHYATADRLEGPWTRLPDLSSDSCNGQFTGVYEVDVAGQHTYLFGATGSTLTNIPAVSGNTWGFYTNTVQPIKFNTATGLFDPVVCENWTEVGVDPPIKYVPPAVTGITNGAHTPGFTMACDINMSLWRLQTFVPPQNVTLDSLELAVGQATNGPAGVIVGGADGDLKVSIVTADASNRPVTELGNSPRILTGGRTGMVKYSPTNMTIPFTGVNLTGGQKYAFLLQGTNTVGCFGIPFSPQLSYMNGVSAYTTNSGALWQTQATTSLQFGINWH